VFIWRVRGWAYHLYLSGEQARVVDRVHTHLRARGCALGLKGSCGGLAVVLLLGGVSVGDSRIVAVVAVVVMCIF
jgi:hypothetical protein